MLQTFLAAKQSGILNIASVVPSSPEFKRLVNDATERLLRRGDWEGTVVPIQVCARRGCIVWPRYVGQIRRISVCRSPIQTDNLWWSMLPYEPHRAAACYANFCGAPCNVQVKGRTPTFSSIYGTGRTIRAYPSTPLDVNKTVTIFGIDSNGQTITTQGSGGWTEGVKIILKQPYGEALTITGTAMQVRSIDRVLKDPTQGPVRLYAYDTAAAVLEDLGYYEPSETNPSYIRSQLNIPGCAVTSNVSDGDCPVSKPIVALVKLQFVPVQADSDLVLIDNLAALKLMIMSIRSEEAGDFKSKQLSELNAIRELNLQLWDRDADDAVPVSLGEFNGMNFGSQRCF